MRKTKEAPFLFHKRDIYYFSRRVPSDLVQHYRCARITMSLKTRSLRAAKARAASLASKLDQDWLSLRWQSTDGEFSRFLSDQVDTAIMASSAPRAIVKSGVWASKSSGNLISLHDFNSVSEFDSCYNFFQAVEAA